MAVIGVLLFLLILIYAFATLIQVISTVASYHTNKYFGPYFMMRKLRKRYLLAIQDNMPYYEKLSKKNQQLFERRVQRFIDIKEFVPRGELEIVTDEMKALIAGTAIKLTFGYPSIYLTHFWKILLYNNNYYSEITKKYHKGEVNTKGLVVLSWTNFIKGHEITKDGINLGLHEMAHALRIENAIKNEEHNFLDFNSLYAFTILSKREIAKMKKGKSSILRNYASTNEHEFFSVFVENFFERPILLKNEHPKLFEAMRRLLKQDPSNGQII